MFKFGIHRTLVDDSPVKLLMLPGGKEAIRSRCLSDDELSALIKNRDGVFKSPPIRHALMLLLLTLQRRGELAMAKWSEVDLDKAIWNIPAANSKTEAACSVPLSSWAVDEFKELKRLAGRSSYVFPDTTGANHADPKLITRSVARCQKRLKELKVAKFTGHDLRRTGRTGLSKLKITPHIAERCLNHAAGSIIERTYDVHDYIEERRAALDKWSVHLRGLAA
jgi:integrase